MCMHASYLRMIGGSDSMLCVCSFKECLSNFIDKFSSLVTEDNSIGQPYVQNTCVTVNNYN